MININNEIEQSILGSILLDNNLMNEAIGQGIKSEMFHSRCHKELWMLFKRLNIKRVIIDLNTLAIENGGTLEDLGGASYLVEIVSGVPTVIGFKDWLKILIEQYQKRKIKELGYYIQKETEKEPDEVVSEIQQKTLDILKIGSNEIQDKETRYMNHIENKYKVKYGEIEAAYKSGFKHLDERLGGFKKGNYVTVVSGSGVGKTTFSINMAYRMAKAGIKTAYYTIEMTEGEMLDKVASSDLEIDLKKISSSTLTDEELKKVEAFTNNLLEVPLDIIQDKTTTEELLNDIMYRSLSSSAEVIFIDYLQLYCESSKGNNLSEKLGDLTINLKKLAQRNSITIIALAQTNRVANSRVKEDDPQSFLLSEQDIQDSSRIFQNSNIVLGIARNTFLDDEDKKKALIDNRKLSYNSLDITVNPELMLVQVMKNRGGSIGKVGLRYIGRLSKIDNFK